MSQIKTNDTKIEVSARKYLFAEGFRYRKNDKRFPEKPDIVLPKYKAVIFANVCFWHMNNGCQYGRLPKSNIDYWKEKLERNAKNNTIKDFEFSYFDNIDDALIEGLKQNKDFFSLLLNNQEIKKQVLGIFTEEIYNSFKVMEKQKNR